MIKPDKFKLREFFLNKRFSLSSLEIRQMSRDICKRILSAESISDKKIVACYLAVNNEPNVKKVIGHFLKAEKTIVIPAFLENFKKYKFVNLSSLNDLKIGPYQIPQPSTLIPIDPKGIDLALVPGLAFSQNGKRLGYGKGVYDKLLANTNALKIGVCFDFQIIDNFNAESHDLRVNFIITEKRIIKTHNF